jgi:uncharacterized membrane protein YkvA (DUF1232 family)
MTCNRSMPKSSSRRCFQSDSVQSDSVQSDSVQSGRLLELDQMIAALKATAKRLKREVMTLYFAARDSRTPILARGLAFLVVGYALSPFDLIPDVIPVLGLLDDVILVPLGIWLVLKFVPSIVLELARERANELESRPVSWVGAAFMVLVWLFTALLVWRWLAGFQK